jgi:hypothetical protein
VLGVSFSRAMIFKNQAFSANLILMNTQGAAKSDHSITLV